MTEAPSVDDKTADELRELAEGHESRAVRRRARTRLTSAPSAG